MDDFLKDSIEIAQYLLPGFLATWVFYAFTAHPKPNQFERVIEALIFTLVVQATVYLERLAVLCLGQHWALRAWTTDARLVCAMITAVLLGTVFAYFANNDGFHRLVRRCGITRQTSFPSEWFGVFTKNVTYVVLHLKDERRLYGWPVEWPSDPTKGHFVIAQASWLEDPAEGGEIGAQEHQQAGSRERLLAGVESILINVEDVKWVEFMQRTWEEGDEPKNANPTPAIPDA
jgi:hypothetical protein